MPDNRPNLGAVFSSGSHQLAHAVTPSPDGDDLLADVTLTKRVRSALCPPLESLGFKIVEQRRCDDLGVICKAVEVAVREPVSFVLLHIPKAMLATPNGRNVMAVNYLQHILDKGDRVLIFSDGLKDVPEPPYRKMWTVWTGEGKVAATYVPWNDLEFVARKPDGERAGALKDVLEIAGIDCLGPAPNGPNGQAMAAAVAARRPPPDVELSTAETDLFTNVVAQQAYAAVEPKAFFNDLASRTGLDERVVRRLTGVWTGDVEIDARRLVTWARARNSFPPNHERRNEAVLGVLIELLAEATYSEDIRELGRMAVRRRLLSPSATEALARELDIEAEAVP